MTTLREARKLGKLDNFVAEREASETPSDGDETAFNRALASMAGKLKATPEASTPERDDG